MAGSTLEQVVLLVRGMSCGGCAAGVQRTLAQVEGVREAQVSFTTGQATVEYDPAQTHPERLAAVVTAAGFDVAPLA